MSSRIFQRLTLVAVLGLLAVPALQAQHRGGYLARKGMWFHLGAGYGSLGTSCSFCSTDRDNGASGTLGIGATLNPHLTLGVETNGFYKEVDVGQTNKSKETSGQVGLSAHYYPSPTGNMFIRASAGLSLYRLSDLDIDNDGIPDGDATANGMGIGMGVGYDFYLGKTFSLTPYFNYLIGLSGNLKFDGTDLGEKLKPNLWQVGIAAAFH